MESKRKLFIVIVLVIAVFGLYQIFDFGGNSSGEPATNNTQAPLPIDYVTGDVENIHVLGIVTDESIGKYFTHPVSGKTLYTSNGSCIGGCLNTWAVYTGNEAWKDGDFDTITREDTGELQFTWLGKELYTFNEDTQVGDVLGDGYSEGWSIARP